MIKGGDLIIIDHHLAVPVKKENPWPFVLAHVETTRDGYTVRDPYRKVKSVSVAWGKIFTGIKNELPQKRLVEKGIINHNYKFSILSARGKDFFLIFSTLTILLSIIKL
jgi:hypothetical protein